MFSRQIHRSVFNLDVKSVKTKPTALRQNRSKSASKKFAELIESPAGNNCVQPSEVKELNLATAYPYFKRGLTDEVFGPDFAVSVELTKPLPENLATPLPLLQSASCEKYPESEVACQWLPGENLDRFADNAYRYFHIKSSR